MDLLVEPASTTSLFTLAALQIEAERLLGVSVDVLTPRSLPRVAGTDPERSGCPMTKAHHWHVCRNNFKTSSSD
ncbi:MAG: hypothetical protein IPJ97_16755 [Proteobacteria bacterium]|nr:hypothetical protein [Pseudomonadota bacterium]